MTSEDPRTLIILYDSLALRRAAFVSLLDPWANGNNIQILPKDEGPDSSSDSDQPIALEVMVLGAARVEDPAVQVQLSQRRRLRPDVPLALVSDHQDRGEVTAAFRYGARGFVPTTLEPELAKQAFGFILAGGTFFPPQILDRMPHDGAVSNNRKNGQANSLTPRQLDVLALLREGKSNKLIARDLSMCESTVKVHVRQIMRKLGAANRTQAALTGISAGTSLTMNTAGSPAPAPAPAATDREKSPPHDRGATVALQHVRAR